MSKVLEDLSVEVLSDILITNLQEIWLLVSMALVCGKTHKTLNLSSEELSGEPPDLFQGDFSSDVHIFTFLGRFQFILNKLVHL